LRLITFSSASAATCEAITGVPGSYAACCAGIETLLSRRISLALKTTLTRQNVHELEAMRQMADNWGISFTASWLLSKRRDGALSEAADCRLPAAQCVELEATDAASAHGWEEAALRHSSPVGDKTFYCDAGRTSFVISPAGKMNLCQQMPLPAARPLEIGFPEAWEEVRRFVGAAPPMSAACLACNLRNFCSRCPAWSLLETGTLSEPAPYLCEIAQARKDYYGRPA
jgi:radical SAM protein with 4Fe4S-binding SPASM domain